MWIRRSLGRKGTEGYVLDVENQSWVSGRHNWPTVGHYLGVQHQAEERKYHPLRQRSVHSKGMRHDLVPDAPTSFRLMLVIAILRMVPVNDEVENNKIRDRSEGLYSL